jgi:hypothetical protein
MSKRQPTDYVVLMDTGDRERPDLILEEVGEVRAYTPQQAKRKAATLPRVESTVTQMRRAVVYTVPARNLSPGLVEAVTTARITGDTARVAGGNDE